MIESLYLVDTCNLCDLCDFVIHQNNEPDLYNALILREGTDKNSATRKLFGRLLMYVDPYLYPNRVFVFLILLRFNVTMEHEEFDFGYNTTWFNRNVLHLIPNASIKRKKSSAPIEAESLEDNQVISNVALYLDIMPIFIILLRCIYTLCLYLHDVSTYKSCKYKYCLYLQPHTLFYNIFWKVKYFFFTIFVCMYIIYLYLYHVSTDCSCIC